MTTEVVAKAREMADGMTIESNTVGEIILDILKREDEVAWLRYLSVFSAFQIPDQFTQGFTAG